MGKPRARTEYDNRQQTEDRGGGGGSKVPRQIRFFDERLGKKIHYLNPSGGDSPVVFKPFPALDYNDDDLFVPGRRTSEKNDFNEFYVVRAGLSWTGWSDKAAGKDNRVSFWLDDPRMGRNADYRRYNPWRILYYKAIAAQKAGARSFWRLEWNELMDENPPVGQLALKKQEKTFVIIQGAVARAGRDDKKGDREYVKDFLQHRETPLGLAPEDELPVMIFSSTAIDAISGLYNLEASEKTLQTRRANLEKRSQKLGRELSEPDWFGYEHGDPIGDLVKTSEGQAFRDGRVLQLFNPAQGWRPKSLADSTWDGTLKSPKEKTGMQGWEAKALKEWEHEISGYKITGGYTPAELKIVHQKAAFYFPVGGLDSGEPETPGLLYFAPHEQQAIWLAHAFFPVRDLVRLCWEQEPQDWLHSAELQKVLRDAHSVSVPGAGDDEDDGYGDDEEETYDEEEAVLAEGAGDNEEEDYDDAEVEDEADDEEEEEEDYDDEDYDDEVTGDEGFGDYDGADEAEEDEEEDEAEADDEEEDEDYDDGSDADHGDYGADDPDFDEEGEYLDGEGYDDSEEEAEDPTPPPAPKPKPTAKPKSKADPRSQQASRREELERQFPKGDAERRSASRPSRPQSGPPAPHTSAKVKRPANPAIAAPKSAGKKAAPKSAAPKKPLPAAKKGAQKKATKKKGKR